MALTPSRMVSLGTLAPDFSLPDVVTGKIVSLKDFQGDQVLLVMFICRHCPYVQHVKTELVRLGIIYHGKKIAIAAISANDAVKYPDDSLEKLREMAIDLDLKYPLLYDQTQEVAKAYFATCTPDFFLFDQNRKLVYRGQLDESRPENGKPVTGRDLKAAIDAVLAAQSVNPNQKPSMGCNIKWKTGKEPAYARVV